MSQANQRTIIESMLLASKAVGEDPLDVVDRYLSEYVPNRPRSIFTIAHVGHALTNEPVEWLRLKFNPNKPLNKIGNVIHDGSEDAGYWIGHLITWAGCAIAIIAPVGLGIYIGSLIF